MKWIHKFLNSILSISIVLTAVVLAFVVFKKKEIASKSVQKSSVKNLDPEELINKHMQATQKKLTVDKYYSKQIITAKEMHADPMRPKIQEVDPSKIPIEKQIWKDQPSKASLDDQFNQRVISQEQQKREDEEYKKEYARQVIENARKDGYQVVLDDNLEIIKIEPLRKPSNQNKSKYDALDVKKPD